jgi:hypothetical protein
LHPHLVDDLTSISARERVSWQRTLVDTVLCNADTTIEAQIVLATGETDTATSTHVLNKTLAFRGLATLDDFSRPTGIELAGIESLADDPDRQAWQLVVDVQFPAVLQSRSCATTVDTFATYSDRVSVLDEASPGVSQVVLIAGHARSRRYLRDCCSLWRPVLAIPECRDSGQRSCLGPSVFKSASEPIGAVGIAGRHRLRDFGIAGPAGPAPARSLCHVPRNMSCTSRHVVRLGCNRARTPPG